MPKSYPKWITGKTPHTDSKAKPNSWRNVKGACVIEVGKAHYRGVNLNDGRFELYEAVKTLPSGKVRAEVICSWFGVIPPTCYPHITLRGKYEIKEGYKGEVIDNIGR